LIRSKLVTTFVCVEASTARFVKVSRSREQSNTNATQHQYELLDVLAFNFCSGEYRLLVIDSVMALFRTDYSGRGELAERQQALGQFLKRLAALAEEFNVCVMMVSLTSLG
jgi:RecA/RadA recombinase